MLRTFAAVNGAVISLVAFVLAMIGWGLAMFSGLFVHAAAWLTDTEVE